MSRAYDFIKDLNKDKDIWKIAVRVIDSWVVTGTNGFQHLEMVIVDAKVCTLYFIIFTIIYLFFGY
jgi:hypothetical protein